MRKGRIFFIIISILMLCNAAFLPMYCEGGGMLVFRSEYSFAHVIGDLIMVEGSYKLWVVHMTLGVFLPAVVMLATALTRMRRIYSLFNIFGILIWFFNIFRYAFEKGFTSLIEVDSTDVSIGAWVAVLLFLISALVLLFTKPVKADEKHPVAEYCPYC